MGSPLPTLFRGRGDSFSFWGNTPLIGEVEEVVASEPLGASNTFLWLPRVERILFCLRHR